jgi:GDP-L-fucose synthase
MKVLICGASGMVGKNLLDLAPSYINLLIPDYNELDLTNYNLTEKYFLKHKPDLIINSAGIVGGIQDNIARPVDFLVKNVDIGRNILMAGLNAKIKNILNLGSSCMYPRNADNPLKEDYILKGELEPTNEAYALAKIYTQRLCSYISKQHKDFNYKTAIPCNLYGKYDKFEDDKSHMIPAVIKKIHLAKNNNSSEVEIWGDGKARREFMYAEDVASILWQIALKLNEMPEVMNIGLGYDYSISEYYKTIAKVIGYKGDFFYNTQKPIGMKQKLVDISLMKQFNLTHKYSLEEGIEKTYNYYLKNIKYS